MHHGSYLLLGLALGCASFGANADAPRSDAYRRGVTAAKADIQEEIAFVYSYGLPDLRQYQAETGLPQYQIAGCIVDDDILDRAKGYNETVAAWIASGGEPKNSLKPWVDELHELGKWWHAQPSEPVRLDVDAITSADGKNKIALNPAAQRASARTVTVTVTADNGEKMAYVYGDAGRPAVVRWGPEGSRTVVLCVESTEGINYTLIELRRAIVLDRQMVPNPPSTRPVSGG